MTRQVFRVYPALKISGARQRWSRPLSGVTLIRPALLVVADLLKNKLVHNLDATPTSSNYEGVLMIWRPIK